MRPPGEVLRAVEWEVRVVELSVARQLVAAHHYAGAASNTATYRHGLFRRGEDECHGAALWIPAPIGPARLIGGEDWRKVIALSRLVISPGVPTNGATFLLARSVRLVAAAGDWRWAVTYADTAEGHTGAIYRAANWRYDGITRADHSAWIDAAGRRVAAKARVNRTSEQMRALGYSRRPGSAKHRFTLDLSER